MDTGTLKRYTNLASLVSILKNKELTLLDPSTWEDKNDSHYLRQFAERKGQSLYLLCFTSALETAHHWRAFSSGTDGVCIKIFAKPFKDYLNTIKEIVHREVQYKRINQVETEPITIDQLPFLKRHAFRDEVEYRVIYRKKAPSTLRTHAIPLDISLIKEIILSNSIHKSLRDPIVELLQGIDGCENIQISRSTLNENLRWKRASKRAT